jgi:deazaflavin-dependent oxidoreductase (nitroreductase family)
VTGFRRFIAENPWLVPYITWIHRLLYQISGGRMGAGPSQGTQFILLTTTGRKSGKERVAPLLCIAEADRWVVVASNGGTERTPAWWLNLQSHPIGQLQWGRDRHEVRGRQATDAETEALWPRLMGVWEFFGAYQERTEREIPVVILERS